ncbi:hypothetical protein ACFV19_27565 [Streptomyces griseoluteus]|uniref:hypothetical protein n=1 Tax=Streptomyces griseoluteus TaxID=29306 RepID=UPI00369B6BAF
MAHPHVVALPGNHWKTIREGSTSNVTVHGKKYGEFEALTEAAGRTPSDAVIEAMHDWVNRRRCQHGTDDVSEAGAE